MKTLYVPKGKTLHYDHLECQNIVVDGTLRVDSAVRAQHISGNGFLNAVSIYVSSLCIPNIDTVKLVCDVLTAKHVNAIDMIVNSSAVVSGYLEAEYVDAEKLTLGRHQIMELHAKEVVCLSEKSRSVLGALLAGFIRKLWLSMTHRVPTDAKYRISDSPSTSEAPGAAANTASSEHSKPAPGQKEEALSLEGEEPTEGPILEPERHADTLADDFEFKRLRAMYLLLKDEGYILRLAARHKPAKKHLDGSKPHAEGEQLVEHGTNDAAAYPPAA